MERKYEINIKSLSQRLDKEGLKITQNLLASESIVTYINEVWNNNSTQKIGYKKLAEMAAIEPNRDSQDTFSSDIPYLITHSEKHKGYYSVIFLTDQNNERQPYVIGIPIKQGAKAILKHAFNLATGEHVALKITRGVTTELNEFQKSEIGREREGLMFVQKYRAEVESKRKQHLAQEFIQGKDLSGLVLEIYKDLEKNVAEIPQSTIPTIMHAIICMTTAFAALHNEGYVHRDLKPDNIMTIRNSQADRDSSEPRISDTIIIDFGSMDKNIGKECSDTLGTGTYFAPELHSQENDKIKFTQYSDVYAMGLTLKSLVELLKLDALKAHVIKNPNLKKLRANYSNMVDELKKLSDNMTNEEQKQRITAFDVMSQINVLCKNPDYTQFIHQSTQDIVNHNEIERHP
jgi:serine/threonine protein kinase